MEHISVLLEESIELLNIKPDGIYVDGTLGRGGHSSEILKRLTTGHLYCFDQDEIAIDSCQERFKDDSRVTLIKDNFRNIKKALEDYGVTKIDGLLLDLGVSSPMFDNADYGFSYNYDGPLDMRMDKSNELSALEVVNNYSLQELTNVIRNYGEDNFAYQIAKSIVRTREQKKIETTGQLVEAIKDALPEKVKRAKGHPAKKTFQAIRIEVNDELGALEYVLNQGLELLNSKGRIAVISFQSLEDRIVKETFKKVTTNDQSLTRLPLKESEMPSLDYQLVTKKPITASEIELEANNRAHSAKLRAIERK